MTATPRSLGCSPCTGAIRSQADTVPKTFVGEGAMRFITTGAGAGTEPIGQRIITIPQDEDAAEARNPRHGFNHFVPPGSIKKGEDLVKTGGNGKTVPCAVCHGPTLHGLGEVPPIANRDPQPGVIVHSDHGVQGRFNRWSQHRLGEASVGVR